MTDDEAYLIAYQATILRLEKAETIIREQRALLDECEELLSALGYELQELDGSQAGLTAIDATLTKLRAQELEDD